MSVEATEVGPEGIASTPTTIHAVTSNSQSNMEEKVFSGDRTTLYDWYFGYKYSWLHIAQSLLNYVKDLFHVKFHIWCVVLVPYALKDAIRLRT